MHDTNSLTLLPAQIHDRRHLAAFAGNDPALLAGKVEGNKEALDEEASKKAHRMDAINQRVHSWRVRAHHLAHRAPVLPEADASQRQILSRSGDRVKCHVSPFAQAVRTRATCGASPP